MNMLDALKSEIEEDGKSMRHCENKNERLKDAEPKIVNGGIHNLDDTDVKKSSSGPCRSRRHGPWGGCIFVSDTPPSVSGTSPSTPLEPLGAEARNRLQAPTEGEPHDAASSHSAHRGRAARCGKQLQAPTKRELHSGTEPLTPTEGEMLRPVAGQKLMRYPTSEAAAMGRHQRNMRRRA